MSETPIQRLLLNKGAYFGETIDIVKVLDCCLAAAEKYGWEREQILCEGDVCLWAFHRKGTGEGACPTTAGEGARPTTGRRIYISTGMHGDEPAGPLAALRLLEENEWPEDAEIWLLPCLNPTGFPSNTRENRNKVDLNREYHGSKEAEVIAHIAWLEKQPKFDVALCLHEDWESHGFYVYELNPDERPSYSEPMIEAVSKVCPIDLSHEIEGRPAQGGIIRPSIDPASRPQWPEAFYLLQHKTRLSYTLEAPSDFPIRPRVDALVAGTRVVLNEQ
ncbi:MAG TPA: succinylglutamate desuccinylase/aspartoacylase family protein [Verrucomicrobiae bacterium]